MTNYKYGRTIRERVLSRLIAGPGGCLIWTGRRNADGYGRVMAGKGTPQYVHRVVYLLFKGQIPEGTELDHLCSNPRCANPFHLEAVTHAENMRRRAAIRKAASS